MVLHNPNNWHWVQKDVSEWTFDLLKENLGKCQDKNEAFSITTEKVTASGEADVCQRKGKVIAIYDLHVEIDFVGTLKNGETEIKKNGKFVITDIVPDCDSLDDYNVKMTVSDEDLDAKEGRAILDYAKQSKFRSEIESFLVSLSDRLIKAHGHEIQHAPGDDPSKGFTRPREHGTAEPEPAKAAPAADPAAHGSKTVSTVNVTQLRYRDEFRTTAEEAFATFTTPERLAAFTRAPPKRFDGAREGGRFELFDGNVSGEFTHLAPPRKLVQKWRLAQWPEGHYSTMTIEFNQNDDEGLTVINMTWDGVPVGHEEISNRNWEEYYIKSIKRTFGFGTIL